jgi:hypothetical protein
MKRQPKIAIFVSGGVIQGIRSNISSQLKIEIVDADDMGSDEADNRWDKLQTELEFGNL